MVQIETVSHTHKFHLLNIKQQNETIFFSLLTEIHGNLSKHCVGKWKRLFNLLNAFQNFLFDKGFIKNYLQKSFFPEFNNIMSLLSKIVLKDCLI